MAGTAKLVRSTDRRESALAFACLYWLCTLAHNSVGKNSILYGGHAQILILICLLFFSLQN